MEVMVAMLLLTMTAVMIYSILNRSILFAHKGESKMLALEKEYGLHSLLKRQVESCWYDIKNKKVGLYGDEEIVRIITKTSFLHPESSMVMAFYLKNDQTIYYLERQDFYNNDYLDWTPDLDLMMPLITTTREMNIQYDEDLGFVQLTYHDKEYEFWPWCGSETGAGENNE